MRSDLPGWSGRERRPADVEGLGDLKEELELLAVEGDAPDLDRVLGGHDAVPSVDTEQAVAVVRVAEWVAELHVRGVVSARVALVSSR